MFARYKSASKWEEAPMLPRSSGSAYEFLFAALPEPVEYYVEAAGVRSKTYKLDVIDMPAIKKIKVTYHFPSWLKLPDATEDPGGDLRAVAGTVAELTVDTDRPLKNGQIEIDDGSHVAWIAVVRKYADRESDHSEGWHVSFRGRRAGPKRAPERGLFHRSARRISPPTVKIVHPRCGREGESH